MRGLQHLEQRAVETAAWCGRLSQSGRGVFSPELEPGRLVRAIIAESRAFPRFSREDEDEVRSIVADVCATRRALLGADSALPEIEQSGRILVYYPSLTDFVALGVETGLVDEADAPAWDLWIGTGTHGGRFCVVAFVPAELVQAAEQAIGLSPTGALSWCGLDEVV